MYVCEYVWKKVVRKQYFETVEKCVRNGKGKHVGQLEDLRYVSIRLL